MAIDNKDANLLWAIGGVLAGSFLARKAIEHSKKSRAEIDYPDESEDCYTEVFKLIEDWEPSDVCENEADFAYDLAEHIEQNSEYVVEVNPHGPEGIPDIVVEDLLALELKLGLRKTERDRAIGQCLGYSRQWMTWLVLIDVPLTKAKRVVELLEDKHNEQIVVWTVDS